MTKMELAIVYHSMQATAKEEVGEREERKEVDEKSFLLKKEKRRHIKLRQQGI